MENDSSDNSDIESESQKSNLKRHSASQNAQRASRATQQSMKVFRLSGGKRVKKENAPSSSNTVHDEVQESDYEENDCQNESSLNITATQPAINNSQSEFFLFSFKFKSINHSCIHLIIVSRLTCILSQDVLQFGLKTYLYLS
jgi:hypothetical protein